MKHNNITTSNFADCCQQLHEVINASANFLLTAERHPQFDILHSESGCMRSARVARRRPVTHEITAQSAVMAAVLPASFDNPNERLYDHRRWQLLVYSWLPADTTRNLMDYLKSRDLTGKPAASVTFFMVTPQGCEKL